MGDRVLEALAKVGAPGDDVISAAGNRNINFRPEYLKCALDDLMAEEGVDVLLHTVLVDAEAADGRVTAIPLRRRRGLLSRGGRRLRGRHRRRQPDPPGRRPDHVGRRQRHGPGGHHALPHERGGHLLRHEPRRGGAGRAPGQAGGHPRSDQGEGLHPQDGGLRHRHRAPAQRHPQGAERAGAHPPGAGDPAGRSSPM